jgi:hypothetical protein
VDGSGKTALDLATQFSHSAVQNLLKYQPSKHVTDLAPLRARQPLVSLIN